MQILCESIIGFKDGKPKVNITWQESAHPMTLSVEETQELALNMLSCVEAAIHDTLMWEWAMENLPGDTKQEKMAQAATLLNVFREWRGDKRL